MCGSMFFGRNSFSVELGIGKLNRHQKKRTQPAAVKELSQQSVFISVYRTTASQLIITEGF